MMTVSDLLGLNGKVAVVLGAGQGMGEAICLALAGAGCDLVCVDLDEARAASVAHRVRAIGRKAHVVAGDITRDDDTIAILRAAEAAFARLDVLVTVVGSAGFRPLLETTLEQWDEEQRINLRYVFRAAQAFAAERISRGQAAAIVTIGSVSGLMAAPRHAAYGAAKAGLAHLVKSMASEWGIHGIRVNSVAPGSIITPRLPDTTEWREQIARSPLPLHRRGTAEEVANAVLFLCSDMAAYVTGQTLAVDGGLAIANVMAVPPNQKDRAT